MNKQQLIDYLQTIEFLLHNRTVRLFETGAMVLCDKINKFKNNVMIFKDIVYMDNKFHITINSYGRGYFVEIEHKHICYW